MKKEIYFVSSSKYKACCYKKRLAKIGWRLVHVNIAIPESRDFDCEKVALNKLKLAKKVVRNHLVFVEDRGLRLKDFNNFPGSHIKILTEMIGLNKFGEMIKKRKFDAIFVYAIALSGINNKTIVFRGEEVGCIKYDKNKKITDLFDVFCHHLFPNTPISLLNKSQRIKYEQSWTKEDAMCKMMKFLDN